MTTDGGLGLCHEAVAALLPAWYHGLLIVALDSNVLIDLQQHGADLLSDEGMGGDDDYHEQLFAVGAILDIWVLRDIRLIVTRRSRTGARRLSERFLARRGPAIDTLAESLAFQFGDWTVRPPSDHEVVPVGSVTGIPNGADLDLVLEAQSVGAHVFLTCDEQVLTRASVTGPVLRILPPTQLAHEFVLAGVQLFEGGLCSAYDCPYAVVITPAPDMGKWTGLISLFEEN